MKTSFLDFEQSIADLEAKIEELRFVQDDSAVDISEEIDRLEQKSAQLTKDIYAKLSPWQISQVARHPQRPTRWITSSTSSPILKSCMAIVPLPMTTPSWAVWPVSMVSR